MAYLEEPAQDGQRAGGHAAVEQAETPVADKSCLAGRRVAGGGKEGVSRALPVSPVPPVTPICPTRRSPEEEPLQRALRLQPAGVQGGHRRRAGVEDGLPGVDGGNESGFHGEAGQEIPAGRRVASSGEQAPHRPPGPGMAGRDTCAPRAARCPHLGTPRDCCRPPAPAPCWPAAWLLGIAPCHGGG